LESLKFSPPYYDEADIAGVATCIQNGWTGSGPVLKNFEDTFSLYKSVNYSIGLSSCTSALFLALKALGVKEGDEILTTSMTFCSTVNVILHCGATPVLCDIDPFSHNIDVLDIERRITQKTKVIIPVHYAGYPCDMQKIMDIANTYDLYVVEDCAHAIEAKIAGQHCGTFGDIGCFSFYATKNIAIGEGGMAITRHEHLASKISNLSLHGLSKDAWRRFAESSRRSYDVTAIGYKMNMTDIQASLGISQLQKIDTMQSRREKIWHFYNERLLALGLEPPSIPQDCEVTHARHLYTIGLPKGISRDEFVWRAHQEYGVLFGIHYKAITTFSIYKEIFGRDGSADFPVAFDWGERTISLSLSAAVSDDDANRVVDCVEDLMRTKCDS